MKYLILILALTLSQLVQAAPIKFHCDKNVDLVFDNPGYTWGSITMGLQTYQMIPFRVGGYPVFEKYAAEMFQDSAKNRTRLFFPQIALAQPDQTKTYSLYIYNEDDYSGSFDSKSDELRHPTSVLSCKAY